MRQISQYCTIAYIYDKKINIIITPKEYANPKEEIDCIMSYILENDTSGGTIFGDYKFIRNSNLECVYISHNSFELRSSKHVK